jgi:hypothetical protein
MLGVGGVYVRVVIVKLKILFSKVTLVNHGAQSLRTPLAL